MPPKRKIKLSIRRLLYWGIVAVGLYSLVAYLIPPSRDTLIPVLGKNGKWGYINDRGREVLEFEWHSAHMFDAQQLATVGKDVFNFGKIDRYGNVKIPIKWGELGPFDEYGMAIAGEGLASRRDMKYWINLEGEVIYSTEHGHFDEFDSEGMAAVGSALWGRRGWINREGKRVIPRGWMRVGRFDDKGLAPVKSEIDRRWGWIDRQGNLVIDPFLESDSAPDFDSEGMARVTTDEGVSWIDRDFKELIAPFWHGSHPEFDSGGMIAVWEDHKWGWIDRKGKVVIPNKWEHVSPFSEQGVAPVRGIGASSLIDRAGNVLATLPGLALEFDVHGLARVYSEADLAIEKSTKSANYYPNRYSTKHIDGWIDSTGEFVIDLRGGDWLLVGPWEDYVTEITGNAGLIGADYRDSGFYVVARPYEPSWVRDKLDKLAAWLGNAPESEGIDAEFRCYRKDGKLIWSNTSTSYETKCLFVACLAVFVVIVSLIKLVWRRLRSRPPAESST